MPVIEWMLISAVPLSGVVVALYGMVVVIVKLRQAEAAHSEFNDLELVTARAGKVRGLAPFRGEQRRQQKKSVATKSHEAHRGSILLHLTIHRNNSTGVP